MDFPHNQTIYFLFAKCKKWTKGIHISIFLLLQLFCNYLTDIEDHQSCKTKQSSIKQDSYWWDCCFLFRNLFFRKFSWIFSCTLVYIQTISFFYLWYICNMLELKLFILLISFCRLFLWETLHTILQMAKFMTLWLILE